MRRSLISITMATLALLTTMGADAQTLAPKYLRFPDVYGDKVVFSYAGDLWLASTAGGEARRLTSGPGLEVLPKFSPDGKWIAFTGQYSGDEQVYVIPATGGVPRQLTFFPSDGPLTPRQGYDNEVDGWTVDGKSVLFRSLRDEPGPVDGRLYTVPVGGGPVVALPMYRAGRGVYSPDGRNLLYSPLSADFRTWKHYQGGLVEHPYIIDLATKHITSISSDKRSEWSPVWTDRGIYFLSDRDGRQNLYHYDQTSASSQQLTHFKNGDAKFASADRQGQIVFEYEGDIHLFDPATGAERPLAIDVPAEDTIARPHMVKVEKQIEQSVISPNGQRVLFVARGDIFVEPVKDGGAILNLTHSSNAHEREATWSPDGQSIAYVSDTTGEEELWIAAVDGDRAPRQVTHGSHTRYYEPRWAPDGRKLALLDARGNIQMIDASSGVSRVVGTTKSFALRQYEWSPDSRYLAYSQIQSSNNLAINIWDSGNAKTEMVTDPLYNSFEPTWSPDGQYLWFLAIYDVHLQTSEMEFNFAGNKQARIYALALRKNTPTLFGVPNGDEETKAAPKGEEPLNGISLHTMPAGGETHAADDSRKAPRGSEPAGAGKAAKDQSIDFEGLEGRIIRSPLEPDNYVELGVANDHLVYRVAQEQYFGDQAALGDLYSYDLKTAKAKKIKSEVTNYSADRSENVFLVTDKKKEYSVIRASGDPDKIDVSRLQARIDPRREWAEAFDEAWRRYREFFYDPNMHGRDWAAIGAHYRALLPRIGDRADLNYLIGEMIGELGVGHSYVAGGSDEPPDRPKTGLLGARFALDDKSGRWKVTKIFEGDDADPMYRSPLTEFGSRVQVGETLLAIDGQTLTASGSPYLLLGGKADAVVELTVTDSTGVARKVRVKCLKSEASLLRLEQTLAARRAVSRLSGGTIGYVHISDMGPAGLREFVKDWFGQLRKDGVIVDIRGNQGGQVSRMILERLVRQAYSRGYITGVEIPQTYPWGGYTQVFTGEIDMLANETTMSDGDTMAWTFKGAGKGRLIGKRTWGGVIGIGGSGPLIDGGDISVPQYALAGPHGEWVVEGEGVEPDIEVENDQVYLENGSDAQLEAAVHDLQSRIKGHPGTLEGPKPVPARP